MSRVGIQPINVPSEVTITLSEEKVEVRGPKGQMIIPLVKGVKAELKEKQLIVKASEKQKAMHGLTRSLINNAVIGVSNGWSKTLQLVGVGYRVQTDGKKLNLTIGFSHPVEFEAPAGINFTVKNNEITVSGCDKQLVGETAARIRRIKPPEVYKGKGIRYKDEVIHLKPGKAAKTAATGGTK